MLNINQLTDFIVKYIHNYIVGKIQMWKIHKLDLIAKVMSGDLKPVLARQHGMAAAS